MKIHGLNAEQVNEQIDAFHALMMKGMRAACASAASYAFSGHLVAAGDVPPATGGELSTAIDALSVITTQWGEYVAGSLMPELNVIAQKSAKAVVAPLGGMPVVKTEAFISEMANKVTVFGDDVWQAAKTSLITGAQDGESIAELATRVEEVAQVKTKKAHVIAQTTVIAAINGGEWKQMMEAASAFDIQGMKEWEATEDSHTRPTHHAADGQRVPIDAHFVVGGSFLMFPGDPEGAPEEIISCRCTTLYDLDVEDQITASQTSPETLSTDSAVDTNGQISALTAAWDPVQHPRGKDGKFIEAGSYGHVLKDILSTASKFKNLTENDKKSFISQVKGLDANKWDNLKSEQKHAIEKAIDDAIEEGVPGAAKSQQIIDDLNMVSFSEDDTNIFDPNTPLPGSAPLTGVHKEIDDAEKSGKITATQASNLHDLLAIDGEEESVVKSDLDALIYDNELFAEKNKSPEKLAENAIYNAYDAGKINDNEQQVLLDILDNQGHKEATTALAMMQTIQIATPAPTIDAPMGPSIGAPMKITHGLIHAKHEPGDVIAINKQGNTRIVWDGAEYRVQSTDAEGKWTTDEKLKKSKLYAYLGTNHKNAQWHEPKGKQEAPTTHAAPLDAAPAPEPIPHPVASFDAKSLLDTAKTASIGTVVAQGVRPASNDKYRLVVAEHGTGQRYLSEQTWDKIGKNWDETNKHFNADDLKASIKTQEGVGITWSAVAPSVPTTNAPSAPVGLLDTQGSKGAYNLVKANGEKMYSTNGKYLLTKGKSSGNVTVWSKAPHGGWYKPETLFTDEDMPKGLKWKKNEPIDVPSLPDLPDTSGDSNFPLQTEDALQHVLKTGEDLYSPNGKYKLSKKDFAGVGVVQLHKKNPDGTWDEGKAAVGQNVPASASWKKEPGPSLAGPINEPTQSQYDSMWDIGQYGPGKMGEVNTLWEQYTKGMMTQKEAYQQLQLVKNGPDTADLASPSVLDPSKLSTETPTKILQSLKMLLNAGVISDAEHTSLVKSTNNGDLLVPKMVISANKPLVVHEMTDVTPDLGPVINTKVTVDDLIFADSEGDGFTPAAIADAIMNLTPEKWHSLSVDEQDVLDMYLSDLSDNAHAHFMKVVKSPAPLPDAHPELNDVGNAQYKQMIEKYNAGIISKAQVDDLLETMKELYPASVAPPPTAMDLSYLQKSQFYHHFKAEKVSPAWSASKIYHSMHAAKAKMGGDPKIAGMSDAELLKALDMVEQAKTGKVNAYSDKVKEWLKTPNGQKAFKELNPAIPTLTPSLAKKTGAKKVAPPFSAYSVTKKAAKKAAKKVSSTTAGPSITPEEALGDPSVDALANHTSLYNSFKGASYGKYLTDKPEDIYWNAVQQSKANAHMTPGAILTNVDAEGAKKFGVADEHKFMQKVTDWLNTPSGKKKAAEIKAGTWSPASTSSSSSYGSSGYGTSYAHPSNTPIDEKVGPPLQQVEDFDPSKGYDWTKSNSKDFPVITEAKAKQMTANWNAQQGPMNETQKTALRKYTGSSYDPMNDYLRGYSGASAQIHKDVMNAQKGMKLSLEPIVLHRGNGWFPGWSSVEEVKSHLGEDFHQAAFFSASIGGKSAFSGQINFVIECPPGTPMAFVDTFSQHPSEEEMLLGANLNYRVVEIIEGNKAPDNSQHFNTKVTVRLRVIPPSDNAIDVDTSA